MIAAQVAEALGSARDKENLIIGGVVFSELLAHPLVTRSFVENFLKKTDIKVDSELGREIWLEAGLRFAKYAARRRRSSDLQPKRLLADFIIGAHALKSKCKLFTLDKSRYKTDFKDLEIVEL